MKKFDLGRAINTLSNIGVIAGLVFLGVEVGQNQAALEQANTINRQAVLNTAVESYNTWRTLLIQDEELNRIWSESFHEKTLSDEDYARFSWLADNFLWASVSYYEGYKTFGNDTRTHAPTALLSSNLEAPIHRKYWERQGKPMLEHWGYNAFVRAVDEGSAPP